MGEARRRRLFVERCTAEGYTPCRVLPDPCEALLLEAPPGLVHYAPRDGSDPTALNARMLPTWLVDLAFALWQYGKGPTYQRRVFRNALRLSASDGGGALALCSAVGEASLLAVLETEDG